MQRKSWTQPSRCRHEPRMHGHALVFDTECGMLADANDEHTIVDMLEAHCCPWCGGVLNRKEVKDALSRLDDR